MIGAVSGYGCNLNYGMSPYVHGAEKTAVNAAVGAESVSPVQKVPEVFSNGQTERVGKTPEQLEKERDIALDRMNSDPAAEKIKKRLGIEKCETCENRKYVDGSNEANVSFKTPAHIDPSSAATVVMAHEREHVANAVAEGRKPNAELVSATVRLHTAICPECGRSYVSGGVTNTKIKHTTDNSSIDEAKLNFALGKSAKGDLEKAS